MKNLWKSDTIYYFLSINNWRHLPPLNPVPRLEGHVKTYPRCSFHMNWWPSFLMRSSTLLMPSQKRLKTPAMLPLVSIEINRVWSSSLTQTKKFLASLCQIPRASGQSRAIPAQVSKGDTWKRTEKLIRFSVVPLFITPRSKYGIRNTSVNKGICFLH